MRVKKTQGSLTLCWFLHHWEVNACRTCCPYISDQVVEKIYQPSTGNLIAGRKVLHSWPKRKKKTKTDITNDGKRICVNEVNGSKHPRCREMVYKHQINARNHLAAPPSLPVADTVSLNQPLSCSTYHSSPHAFDTTSVRLPINQAFLLPLSVNQPLSSFRFILFLFAVWVKIICVVRYSRSRWHCQWGWVSSPVDE